MSKLKVNSIVNSNDDGAPTFEKGAVVPSGQTFSVQGDVFVSGIATAGTFQGDGSLLTNLAIVSASKAYALRSIIGDPPLRS